VGQRGTQGSNLESPVLETGAFVQFGQCPVAADRSGEAAPEELALASAGGGTRTPKAFATGS
jgi:hypothetical protein